MAVDSFSHSSEDVLNDLDPLSRALLDLSLQRGMDDAEIAGVLGADAESVLEVRVGLLRALAEKVAPESADTDLPELEALVAHHYYGEKVTQTEESAAPKAAEPLPEAEPEAEAPAPVAATPAPSGARKRRSPLVFLLPLLLLAAVAAALVLVVGGGDSDQGAGSQASQPPAQPAAPAQPKAKPEPKAAARPQSRRVRLTALGAGKAGGTATVDGNRLRLKLSGVPAGAHQVWLYDSVIDAKSLGTGRTVELPADARDYEFVDVSLEPADGNPNHSGQSLLRVPVKKLGR